MNCIRPERLGAIGRGVLVAMLALLALAGCRNDDPARLLESARAFQGKGEHQAAIIQLKNAVQQQPENGEARLLLGRSSLFVGDFESAEKELRRALEYRQAPAAVVPLLAQAMLEQGQPNKVIEEFGGTKLETPKAEAELRALVGAAQLRTRELKDAGASFDAALVADPTNVRAQLGKVRLVALEGHTDEAAKRVAAVVAANPGAPEPLVLQGELRVFVGDVSGALASFEQAVAANPANVGARFELISLLIAEKKFDAAASQLDALRATHGADLRVAYADALIAVGKKDLGKARELSQQVLKRAPEHVASLVLAGGVELEQKQYAVAQVHLQKALSLAPQHAGARSLLARTYLASNEPARALEVVQPFAASGAVVDGPTLMLVGETLLANGQLKQAAQYFDSASKAPAQHATAQMRLGQIALASGDLAGGIKLLESATTSDAAPIQADLALIAGYARSGDSARALQAAQGLVKKQPDNPLSYQVLGSVYGSRRDFAAARSAFEKALQINPSYVPAAASLAQLDLADGKPEAARGRFEAVVAKDPKNAAAMLALADLMARTNAPAAELGAMLQRAVTAAPESVAARVSLVNFYLQQKDFRAALAAAQESVAALPRDARVQDALGRAQLAAGETNQAVETFNRVVALDPKSPGPLQRLASVHVGRYEFDKAVDALRRAQKLAPGDPGVARDLVRAYLLAGKREDALRQARDFRAANPKSAAGHILEGDVFAAEKQWPQAERAYREALKMSPSDGAALKLHGTLVGSGRKAEAEAFARKWLTDAPNDMAFRIYLGEQALRAGDYKSAVAQYQAIVAQQPGNAAALNNLAWAAGQLGDPKALEYAQQAVKLAPDSAEVLDTMGVLLSAKGDTAKGLEYLSRAVSRSPDRHDIRLNYAKALLKAGRTEEARKELTQLQAVSQDFAGKAEIPALLKQ